jgi:hypothetical protein
MTYNTWAITLSMASPLVVDITRGKGDNKKLSQHTRGETNHITLPSNPRTGCLYKSVYGALGATDNLYHHCNRALVAIIVNYISSRISSPSWDLKMGKLMLPPSQIILPSSPHLSSCLEVPLTAYSSIEWRSRNLRPKPIPHGVSS